jgi:glycine/D-amino acid oxidase-like deaminating enzyme
MSGVAVVGAGAVGATTAHDLAAAGVDVTLFEREPIDWDGTATPSRTPADAASARAAGVVYDAYAEDVDAALGARSLERFRAFDDTRGFRFHDCPYAICVREGDTERAEATRRAAERMRSHGRPVETVAPDTFGDRFPTLVADDLAVAAVADNAGWANTADYVAAMVGEARAAGVTIRDETPVTLDDSTTLTVADESRSFDAVVVAAGAHTARLCETAGVDLAAVPYRVQALTTRVDTGGSNAAVTERTDAAESERTDVATTQRTDAAATGRTAPAASEPHPGPMWYDATAGTYARPHPEGLLVGDGTVPEPADPAEWRREADDWFQTDALAVARERLRGSVRSASDAWAGVCTATPDGDPLLGRVTEGLYAATGWQGHGFMRSPAHAELLAEQVAADLGVADADPASVPGGESALAAFDPTRFPAGVEFEVQEGMLVEER